MRKRDDNNGLKISPMSYVELPIELRPYFLYLGLYPEDSKISVSDLARSLLADKLIEVEGAQDPEYIVADKLEKLNDRNLIEMSTRSLDGRIKSCRMSLFQRSFCIHIANERDFHQTCRLSIDNHNISERLKYEFKDARLRTLLCFGKHGEMDSIPGEMDSIPDEIGDLRRLICIKLTGHYKQMPSSIGKIEKLEILDVGKAYFDSALPKSTIWKMESIRHLLLSRHHFNLDSENRYIKSEVNLPNLETLGWVRGDILKASSLQNLRKLKLFDATAQHIEEYSKLKKLEQLWLNSDPQQRTELNMSEYHNLARLHLSYDWSYDITLDHISFPPNLVELILKGIKFKRDLMSVLKKLRGLKFLKLKHCLYLLILNCSVPDGFLELLVLEITSSFSKLIVDDTGMPKLSRFVYSGDGQPNISDRLRKIMTIRPTDRTGGLREKTWSDENEKAFMKILHDSVDSRKLQQPTFTIDEWDKINQDMLAVTNLDYGIERLKGKWNHLCMVHHLFSHLLGHNGVTWDPNTNPLNATDEIWQQFYKINKTEYETFRSKGCKHYELLREILGKTTYSTRGLENVSNRQHDDGKSKEHQNEESKISTIELEAFMAQWLGKSFNQLVGSGEGTSQDPYSNIVCLNILNKMEGVSNSVYMKAINAFENPNFRMSFVMMPEIRRGTVLELL